MNNDNSNSAAYSTANDNTEDNGSCASIRNHLEELFKDAPKTRAAYELKEELLANSNERYFDLVGDGIPAKDAIDIVIHSIGDIDQLFLDIQPAIQQPFHESAIKKIALYKSIAIGIYIIGFVFGIAMNEFTPFGDLSVLVMLAMAGLGTCILVYVGAAYPKYKKTEETVVEEFKEWNHNKDKKKAIQNSVSTIIWMVVLILYFILSFVTMAWHITWVIFLIGVCAQAISNLVFQLVD